MSLLRLAVLALGPGAVAGFAVSLGTSPSCGDLPSTVLAATAGTVVTAWTIHHRYLGIRARLPRAMVEVGLFYRRPDGSVTAPRVRGRIRHSGRNVRLRLHLPPGVTLRHVEDRREALEQRLNCGIATWADDGLLHVEVLAHRIPTRVTYADFYRSAAPAGALMVGLGRGRRGDLWLDLGRLPHLLVGGLTGMGKSVFLRQALTYLATSNPPDRLRLVLIDLKGGVELADFGQLPHALLPVADTPERAAAALEAVRQQLDLRLAALREVNLRDVDEWNDRIVPEWPRIVVVLDELAELTTRETGDDKGAREAQKAARSRVQEVARLGRAVGIHLIACTQRPDADAVPGQLKANLPGTLAFHVRNAVNSAILLDSDRAALLPPYPGRAIWQEERSEELQTVDLDAATSRRLLAERWSGPTSPVTQWGQSPNFGHSDPNDGDQSGDDAGVRGE